MQAHLQHYLLPLLPLTHLDQTVLLQLRKTLGEQLLARLYVHTPTHLPQLPLQLVWSDTQGIRVAEEQVDGNEHNLQLGGQVLNSHVLTLTHIPQHCIYLLDPNFPPFTLQHHLHHSLQEEQADSEIPLPQGLQLQSSEPKDPLLESYLQASLRVDLSQFILDYFCDMRSSVGGKDDVFYLLHLQPEFLRRFQQSVDGVRYPYEDEAQPLLLEELQEVFSGGCWVVLEEQLNLFDTHHAGLSVICLLQFVDDLKGREESFSSFAQQLRSNGLLRLLQSLHDVCIDTDYLTAFC